MPTHSRPQVLAETLEQLGRLDPHDAHVVVVDNASTPTVSVPRVLNNSLRVEVVRLETNISAAARNAGVQRCLDVRGGSASESHWIVMLDDDSAPLSSQFLNVLRLTEADVAVVAAEVLLPPSADGETRHEAGGLPEVFIGCGAAIRAGVFQSLGGFDPSFDYYAEEYDLSARVLLSGCRVQFDRRFVVQHRKVEQGRDFDRIVANLVRNNAWVMARYAPDGERDPQIRQQISRYAQVAEREQANAGYQRGLAELKATLPGQPRRPMSEDLWHRFIGYDAACRHLSTLTQLGTTSIVERGKNDDVIEKAARDCGLRLTADPVTADTRLVGTLSPGPMLDGATRLRKTALSRVITPWQLAGGSVGCS